nr:hypothetical protein [Candidatus Sigynarchaeota archaeon]
MENTDLITKIKKFIEKHKWLIILAFLIILLISAIAALWRKNRKEGK